MTDKKNYYHSPKESSTRGTDEQGAIAFEYQQKTRKKAMEKIKENVQKFKDADPTTHGN